MVIEVLVDTEVIADVVPVTPVVALSTMDTHPALRCEPWSSMMVVDTEVIDDGGGHRGHR